MELFFLLLDAQAPLTREHMVAALWQDEQAPPDQTWRSTLHYLRKILGVACITAQHGTYALQLAPAYTVQQDSDAFQKELARAGEAQQAGDFVEASQALTAAVQIYKGDYLASFAHEWCRPRRAELRQMCMSAHQQLAEMAWQRRQLDESLAHWQQMLELDTGSELAHLGIIRCYLAQGKRSQALREYRQYRDFLRDERQGAPGQELQLLYRHLIVDV
jgi:DNA-binding SARP family transcriptional activator